MAFLPARPLRVVREASRLNSTVPALRFASAGMTRNLILRLPGQGLARMAHHTAIGYLQWMATVKKGMLTPSPEWWKHLRWRSRAFWKGERRAAKYEAQAEVAPELVVWRRDASDSQAWIEIIQRDDGLFYFVEERRSHVGDDGIVGAYEYSVPTSQSGLYGNLNDALRDAIEDIDWLSEPEPNP